MLFKIKTTIILLFLIVIFISIASLINAQGSSTSGLEVDYPNLPGSPQFINYLPNYIKYIYVFVVVAGGLIALMSLIFGGIRYISSAGNPSVMTDARSQIFSAFLGLMILLGSYIFLYEINPDIMSLKPPSLIAAGEGIIVYTDELCGDGSDGLPGIAKPIGSIRYLRVVSESVLGDQGFNAAFSVGSFYTFTNSEDTTIEFYNNKDCRTGFVRRIPDDSLTSFDARTCVDPGAAIQGIQCIKIIWHKPGVYLYSYENGNPEERVPAGETFEIYQNSVGGFPNTLDDNVRSIALVDDAEHNIKYGAILHNTPKSGLGKRDRGWAHVFLPNSDLTTETTLYNTPNWDCSSLTIFRINEDAQDSAIQICMNAECIKQDKFPAAVTFNWGGGWEREEADGDITSGSGGLRTLGNLEGAYPGIAQGVRFINNTGDNFDGRWWDAADGSAGVLAGIINDPSNVLGMFDAMDGTSAMTFMRPNASYIAILYDRADAITNTGWRTPGILHPDGDAYVTMTSESDLSMVEYDNVTGSILLIKIK